MPDSHGLLVSIDQDEYSQILLTDREGSWPRPVSLLTGRDHSPRSRLTGWFIVYSTSRWNDLARTDILLACLASGNVHALTSTRPGEQVSCWSPDGSRIAYTSGTRAFTSFPV
jgi:Tol biopolymer transport system component